jgi:hypothetical protein
MPRDSAPFARQPSAPSCARSGPSSAPETERSSTSRTIFTETRGRRSAS